LTASDENSTARTIVGHLEPPDLCRQRSALVVVDLQDLDASPAGAHAQYARELGRWPEIEPYFNRVSDLVVPNVVRLAEAVRDHGGTVIYLRCRSLATDTRDNGRRFREFGIAVGPDDPGAALLAGLELSPNDFVLDKTTASPFWSTNLEHLLRQLGTECLIVTGVVTSGCVESTVRDACDLDYSVVLVEDACADRRLGLHEDAIRRLNNNFAAARSADEVLVDLAEAEVSERSAGVR
jgi:nicotinamidase-related amidase